MLGREAVVARDAVLARESFPQGEGVHERESAPPQEGLAYSPDQVPAGQSRLLLAADPESVKTARNFTAATLRAWRLELLVDEGVIIASELVTNAIRHGCLAGAPAGAGISKVELTWQRYVSRVLCVVTDESSLPPVLVPADMSSESGRGLHVVYALAAAWGWMMVGAREKAVWAALRLP